VTRERRFRARVVLALSLAWVAAVGLGMGLLYEYSLTPGEDAGAPERWPAGTRVELAPRVPTLVMVAHPRCPCTRASIAELARLMTRLEGRIAASVLFVTPPGVDDASSITELWRSAKRIAGVRVIADPGGGEAERFGAKTSGQTILYAQDGRLLFRGGITAARAHEGDNVGSERIVSLVESSAADRSQSAVYGCPIADDGAQGFAVLALRFMTTGELPDR
jgi:hypothetical protein